MADSETPHHSHEPMETDGEPRGDEWNHVMIEEPVRQLTHEEVAAAMVTALARLTHGPGTYICEESTHGATPLPVRCKKLMPICGHLVQVSSIGEWEFCGCSGGGRALMVVGEVPTGKHEWQSSVWSMGQLIVFFLSCCLRFPRSQQHGHCTVSSSVPAKHSAL